MTGPHHPDHHSDDAWDPLDWAPTPYTDEVLQAAAAQQLATAQDQATPVAAGSGRPRRGGWLITAAAVAALLAVATWAVLPQRGGTSTATPSPPVRVSMTLPAATTAPTTVRITLTPAQATATTKVTTKVTVTTRAYTATVTVHPRTTAALVTTAAAEPTTTLPQAPAQPVEPATTHAAAGPPADPATQHPTPAATTSQVSAPTTSVNVAPVISSSIAGDAGSVSTIPGGVSISGASWSGSPGPVSATVVISGPAGTKEISMGSGSSGSWSGTVHTGAGTVRGHVHVTTGNQNYDSPTWSLPVSA